jgi:hypothetical protein
LEIIMERVRCRHHHRLRRTIITFISYHHPSQIMTPTNICIKKLPCIVIEYCDGWIRDVTAKIELFLSISAT